jgi:dolichyl-phosphate beta-glucosyltransferase
MNESIYLSVIIPCLNEEKRLPNTLEAVTAYLNKQSYTSEIIVVDNGSTDRTRDIVKEWQSKDSKIKLLTDKKHGKGWAVRHGMLTAKGEYRLFTDADNSTDISQVEKLLPYAEGSFPVVVSSRKIKGAQINKSQPLLRAILGNIFRYIVAFIVPTGVIDTQNGFKLFTKKAAESIFSLQKIHYWAFDIEILAIARELGFRIKEVPIVWVDDEQSHVTLKGMVRMLYEVMSIRKNLFHNCYNIDHQNQPSLSRI